MAHQRPLGIVEVPAAGMDQAATLIGRLFLPFGHDVIIGFNFEEPLENQREGLGGRFLEGQNLHEMIAQPQMPAMAFEVGLAQVPVKKRIVLEASGFELAGSKFRMRLKTRKASCFPRISAEQKSLIWRMKLRALLSKAAQARSISESIRTTWLRRER